MNHFHDSSTTLLSVEKLVGMQVDGGLSQLMTGCLGVGEQRGDTYDHSCLADSYKVSHTYLDQRLYTTWCMHVCVCVCVCMPWCVCVHVSL